MAAAPYLLVSDLHAHNWSAFSTTNADGVNSRLAITLSELERACDELGLAGGNNVVVAGDLFHVRGTIEPSVFNPTIATIKKLMDRGFNFYMMPGNHDLATRETTKIGNAFQSLETWESEGFCLVVTKPQGYTFPGQHVALIPWMSKCDDLRAELKRMKERLTNSEQVDVIIHAPVDGVLPIPDHGLSPDELVEFGFKRVFAGHYHNHKTFHDGKVVSIGATTHQKWSDIGSRAGFLLVYPDHFKFRASHAPSFVEITDKTDPDEIPLIVEGNYVRVRDLSLKDGEMKAFERDLRDMGAKGISWQIARTDGASRTSGIKVSLSSLEESVVNYVRENIAAFREEDTAETQDAVIAEIKDILTDIERETT